MGETEIARRASVRASAWIPFRLLDVLHAFLRYVQAMLVERVDPQHVLAWRPEDGNWVWTFVVEHRAGRTRPSAATGSAFRR